MTDNSRIKLSTSSLFNIPFHTYDRDFTFVVNGEEIQTSRLISDLLSPKICKMHLNDPNHDIFVINTKNQGNFSNILDLISFDEIEIPENDLPFVIEVIEILGNDSIELQESNQPTEITLENVFSLIQKHEKNSIIYSKRLSEEIEFISSNFCELCNTHKENFNNINISTLLAILSNNKLELETEDQLLKFVNELYLINSKYSVLYESVYFTNVSSETMKEFVNIFDFNDMTALTWKNLTNRLEHDMLHENRSFNKRLYKGKKGLIFSPTENNSFSGILNHLISQSNGNFEQEINITASSYQCTYYPKSAIMYDDTNALFDSQNIENSWICFDFKKRKIMPTDYTIRSSDRTSCDPKSWVIEGSNDCSSWEILDEQKDSSYTKGKKVIHTFHIANPNPKEYRYIRMRSIGPDWAGCNHLTLNAFEIYGSLI